MLAAAAAWGGEPTAGLPAAQAHLETHRLCPDPSPGSQPDPALHERIAAHRDPGTQFGYVVFSLARPATGILSEEQRTALDAIIDARRTAPVNWHDVRNVIRVQAQRLLLPHALETNAEKLAALRSAWEQWTDLRLAYMFQEHIAQDRFQRAAWALLTPAQKTALLRGDHDSQLKKSTGHSRGFFADRIVTKALGKPDHPDVFKTTTDLWRTRWQTIQANLEAAAKFDRQREFAMDEADETFAIASWPAQARAFRAFAEAERDAIRALVQAGYALDEKQIAKAQNASDSLRTEAIEKYRTGAETLLRALGLIE